MEDEIKVTNTAYTWTNELEGGYGTIIKDGYRQEFFTQPDIVGVAPIENLRYEPEEGVYILNGLEMIAEERALVAAYLLTLSTSYLVNLEVIGTRRLREYDVYFAAVKMSDWYAVREIETGVPIPDIVKQRRAYARVKLGELPPLQAKVDFVNPAVSDETFFTELLAVETQRLKITDPDVKFASGIGL